MTNPREVGEAAALIDIYFFRPYLVFGGGEVNTTARPPSGDEWWRCEQKKKSSDYVRIVSASPTENPGSAIDIIHVFVM